MVTAMMVDGCWDISWNAPKKASIGQIWGVKGDGFPTFQEHEPIGDHGNGVRSGAISYRLGVNWGHLQIS